MSILDFVDWIGLGSGVGYTKVIRPRLDLAKLPSPPKFTATRLSAAFSAPGASPTVPRLLPGHHQDGAADIPLDPAGSAANTKEYDPWVFTAFSSPPSPSTIASATDSQVGGDCFPPSSESTEGEDSSVGSGSGHLRRHNLSLNIASLPPAFQQVQPHFHQSPTSVASTGALFTDNAYSSNHNLDLSADYFHFPDAPLSGSAEDSFVSQISLPEQQQQQQHLGHRLPASQPSSPVRGVFPQQYSASPIGGRQRGATFSGSFYHFGQPNSTQFAFNSPVAPALPSHLSFASIQTPSRSPLAPSPVISASPSQLQTQGDGNIFFGAAGQQLPQQQAGAQQPSLSGSSGEDVSMTDMSTPSSAQAQLPTLSRRQSLNKGPSFSQSTIMAQHQHQMQQSQAQAQNQPQMQMQSQQSMEMPNELVDKLSLLDKILDSAQHAKEALLRGEDLGVYTNLGDISNHLEIANELGVGPVQTPRDMNTPSSQNSGQSGPGGSPTPGFKTSPIAQTMMSNQPQYHQIQMLSSSMGTQGHNVPMTVEPSSILPTLSVDPSSAGVQRNNIPPGDTVTPGANLSAADYMAGKMQAPPLVHSHSFPNGHQLPSQLSGTLPSSTPAVPSPSFIASIGVQHMPIVSSPLAAIPPSRAHSPPRYSLPTQPWDVDRMPMDGNLQHAQMHGGPAVQSHQQPPQSQSQPQPQPQSQPQSQQPLMERRPSAVERADGRPIVRGRSTSVNKGWAHTAMSSSVPPSAWQSRAGSPVDDVDEDESDDEVPRKTKRRRSSVGPDGISDMANSGISEEIRKQLDQIFEEFLNRICSDLDVCDSKGEKIHQVLMPKKMQRLDESMDYRPFKFRIQAFTNAFAEELLQRGLTEETMSFKKIKNYLWKQNLISRFNPDGKKAKSKGNHIWNVDAKKLPGGGWVFRPFQRRFIGAPSNFALVKQHYEWEPRIWDPQAASDTLHPKCSSPPGSLPPWLRWEDGVRLVGVPDQPGQAFEIQVLAEFVDGAGCQAVLEGSFQCQVVPHMMSVSDSSQMNTPQAQMFAQSTYTTTPPISFELFSQHPSLGMPPAIAQQPELHFNNGMVYQQPSSYLSQ